MDENTSQQVDVKDYMLFKLHLKGKPIVFKCINEVLDLVLVTPRNQDQAPIWHVQITSKL